MTRYLEGDESVFATLYRAIAPHVRAQIHTVLGADPQLDDLVQDVFLKAHTARSRFDVERLRGTKGVVSWYCAIARNAAISELRRRYVGTGRVIVGMDAEPEELPCRRLDVEHRALVREQRRRAHAAVHRSLASLPEPQRRVVELHKLAGVPMREVAERLGIRPGAARVRAHRAYRAMAEGLGGRDELR